MFDIGWSELLVIGVVALVVLKPKDLPQAFRTAGQWLARARALAREFQGHIDELMRETQVDDMKREFQALTRPPEGLEDEFMAGRLPATPLEEPALTAPAKSAQATTVADETAPVSPPPP